MTYKQISAMIRMFTNDEELNGFTIVTKKIFETANGGMIKSIANEVGGCTGMLRDGTMVSTMFDGEHFGFKDLSINDVSKITSKSKSKKAQQAIEKIKQVHMAVGMLNPRLSEEDRLWFVQNILQKS